MKYEFATSLDEASAKFASKVIEQLTNRGIPSNKLWNDVNASASAAQQSLISSTRIICFVSSAYMADAALSRQFTQAGKKGPNNRIVIAMESPDTLSNTTATNPDARSIITSLGTNMLDASSGTNVDPAKVAEKLMLDAGIKIQIQQRTKLDADVKVIDHTGRVLNKAVSGLATPLIQSLVKVHQKPISQEVVSTLYEGLESRPIGAGGTAEVVLVTHKVSKKRYACKILRTHSLSQNQREMLQAEIAIMQKLDHPNIVKIMEVFVQADKMFIIMELCSGGDLFDRISSTPNSRFSEAYTKTLVVQMLRAMNYLHQNKIMHRDLKLENFLFTTKGEDADIKLIDFGFSVIHDTGQHFDRFVGTPFYMAPEVVMKDYTNAADMWSLGAVIYMMLTGELPIAGNSDRKTLQNIYNLTVKPKNFGKIMNRVPGVRVSKNCEDFVNGLMTVAVPKRMTTTAALAHSWIKRNSELPVNSTPAQDMDGLNSTLGTRILEYADYPLIKRTTLQVAAHYLEADDIKILAEQFSALDVDNNGTIEFNEFYNTLAGHLKSKDLDSDVLSSFLAMDSDKSFRLQFSEFMAAAVSTRSVLTRDALFTAFRALDLNKDGFISREELMENLGAFDAADVETILRECDINSDGAIDAREFRAAICGRQILLPEDLGV